MSFNKGNSRIIGILFILPLLFYGIGNSLVETMISSNSIPPISMDIKFGGLLMIFNSIMVVMIGILLFPILSVYQKSIAWIYIITRIFEAVLLLVGIIGIFALIPLGHQLTENQNEVADFQNFKTFAFGFNYYAYQISMLILGLGSIPFCYLMYKQQLIPSFLAFWGIAGYGLLFTGSVCEFLGYEIGIILSIPGGLFELSFGLWLIIKGFRNVA